MTLTENPKEKEGFDKLLKHLLGFELTWRPDLGENNQFYIRVDRPGGFHDSDGMGFGIVSLLFILDSLRDLDPGDIIVIDEPELSLHPAVQRRLAKRLLDVSTDHQIIIATHSPYFANIGWVQDGAQFARVASGKTGSQIFKLKKETRQKLAGLSADVNNPHSLGLEATEFLFLDEPVVLTEGQEDALLLPRLAEQVGKELKQPLYGWGVGGAEKMKIVCQMLHDFGLRRVIGVLDGDKKKVAEELGKQFTRYKFFVLPAEDIRDKPKRAGVSAKEGIASTKGELHKKHEAAFKSLIDAINGAYRV